MSTFHYSEKVQNLLSALTFAVYKISKTPRNIDEMAYIIYAEPSTMRFISTLLKLFFTDLLCTKLVVNGACFTCKLTRPVVRNVIKRVMH